MKRFTLKTKSRGRLETVTFIVDDEDAPLIRAHVWSAKWNRSGHWEIYRSDLSALAGSLARLIVRPAEDEVVCHAFDDDLDYRKANLIVLTRPQWQSSLSRCGAISQRGAA